MQKINITKETLENMYCKKKMPLQKIANELGTSRQTISNKLKEYGIAIRNSTYIKMKKEKKVKLKRVKKEPLYKNKEDFDRVYKEVRSIEEVAKHYGISKDTAYAWKCRLGVETIRGLSTKGIDLLNEGKPYTNETTLREMYAKYSTMELGKLWNCDPTTICNWLRKFNIPTRTTKEEWDRKAKFGSHVVKLDSFDLQEYKVTYDLGRAHIPKKLKQFIINLFGACESCGEDQVLDLHHIDENHNNNDPINHAILCPNCHAKIHRLGIKFKDLVPNHVSWETLLDSYQDAK